MFPDEKFSKNKTKHNVSQLSISIYLSFLLEKKRMKNKSFMKDPEFLQFLIVQNPKQWLTKNYACIYWTSRYAIQKKVGTHQHF